MLWRWYRSERGVASGLIPGLIAIIADYAQSYGPEPDPLPPTPVCYCADCVLAFATRLYPLRGTDFTPLLLPSQYRNRSFATRMRLVFCSCIFPEQQTSETLSFVESDSDA